MSDQRIIEKLDVIVDKIADIDKTLAVNTEQLKEHVRRSTALENLVDQYKLDTDKKIEEALLPVKTLKGLYSAAKLVVAIGAAISAASGIIYTLLKLHH